MTLCIKNRAQINWFLQSALSLIRRSSAGAQLIAAIPAMIPLCLKKKKRDLSQQNKLPASLAFLETNWRSAVLLSWFHVFRGESKDMGGQGAIQVLFVWISGLHECILVMHVKIYERKGSSVCTIIILCMTLCRKVLNSKTCVHMHLESTSQTARISYFCTSNNKEMLYANVEKSLSWPSHGMLSIDMAGLRSNFCATNAKFANPYRPKGMLHKFACILHTENT